MAETPTPTVGYLIRKRRRDIEVTQLGLGRLVGRSRQWVSAIEANKYLPDTDMLRKIAAALGCPLSTLLPDP